MTPSKSWRWLSKSKSVAPDKGSVLGLKMKQLPFMGILCTFMLFIVYRTTNYQHQHTEVEAQLHPFLKFDTEKEFNGASAKVNYLPRDIAQARSDLELRPLWLSSSARLKVVFPRNQQKGMRRRIELCMCNILTSTNTNIGLPRVKTQSHRNLLAIPAGIKQKKNVDTIVQKFFAENFTVILFHYDCNVDGWRDLEWSNRAIHIAAQNQTKWWFAKRFLHPDIVSIYDYIFLWDEDLGVQNFHPGRYLHIMKSEGLEISQPALDPRSSEIHHRITIRKKSKKLHRRVYETRGSTKCSDASQGPPCTGWVEGMAPVFSRSAWYCTWHLIQNDLVHGWGMDMKLGYCAQGDRTKNVGVIDSEYIVHQGVQTLGGSALKKVSKDNTGGVSVQRRGAAQVDVRSEIRRQSTSELEIFKKRWERAAKEDKDWVDPFERKLRRRLNR